MTSNAKGEHSVSFFDRFKIRARSADDVRNRKSDGIEELSAVVWEHPDDWTAANDLADALAHDGRIDEAVTRLCALGDRLAEEGFLARAHAIYKKALRLQPQDRYAASRAAELNTERINQSRSRFGPGIDETRLIEPVPNAAPTLSPVPVAPAIVAAAPLVVLDPALVSPSEQHESPGSSEATEPGTPPSAEALCEPGCTVDVPSTYSIDEPSAANPRSGATAPALGDAAKTVEEILRDASSAATYGAIDTAVSMLKECARTHPDLLEPVATLAEIATTSGLVDVRDEAEARLCDLYCRRGDYHAARSVAEALATRYPDDLRHRARLDFVETELEQCAVLDAPASVTTMLVTAPDHTADTLMDVQVGDLEASGSACAVAPVEPVVPGGTGTSPERAAAVDEHGFAASCERARFDAEAGDWTGALAWLERAAAAIPGPEDEESLAYEIAVVLEGAGEHDRALGVLYEIAAKAGPEYRDISERIVRLSSARGAIREQLVAS
jgi:tetratricopeptide (TPR) repeat protein